MSAWASPIVMVPKADGTLRSCNNFRKVKNISVPDPFPLPRAEDLLDRVGKAKYLTKLDMTQRYWQVSMNCRCRRQSVASVNHSRPLKSALLHT